MAKNYLATLLLFGVDLNKSRIYTYWSIYGL